MTERSRPTLHYRIAVFPKGAHIDVGIFSYGGKVPPELVVPGATFLGEKLSSEWGAFDKAHCLRYRICVLKVEDPSNLELAIANKLELIKIEWKELLEQTAHQADLSRLALPEWTELV